MKIVTQIEYYTEKQTVTWHKNYDKKNTWIVTVREHGCNYWTWANITKVPSIDNTLYFVDLYENKHRKKLQE